MLQALLEYARQERLTAEPGLKPKIVRWLLVFSAEGRFLGVQDLGADQPRKGREFPACPDLTQQEMVAAGAGCRHFLVDSLDVVALLTKDGQVDDKQAAKHEYFVGLLEQAAECLPVLKPIAVSLRDTSILETVRAKLAEGKAKPTELATLAVPDAAGSPILVEQASWRDWWQTFRCRLAEDRKAKASPGRRKAKPGEEAGQMRCLLSGELVEPLATHNKIEGLSDVGGLSMGDALTSFDKEAFCSYGLKQGANAAMGETMVKTYVTALNHLIRYRSHRVAGVKVLYWYSGRVEQDDDPLEELFQGFGASAEDSTEETDSQQDASSSVRQRAQAESRARRLLDAIRSGQRPELIDFRYYALTLSANSGRVVIRDWMEGSFEELLCAITRWFDDLAIVCRDGSHVISSQKFAAVLAAPLRDLKDAPAPLVASLWRCALKGHPIPYPVMAQTLQRVRLDLIQGESPRHARFGLLKAFCNRVDRIPNMNAELNDYETKPAYLCGRILAILARIQEVALPGVGAGIVQRYYAAASATPALVLGRLVRTVQIAHLPKIGSKGLQRWFENQLAEVWNKLIQSPPAVLTLEEQTLFAMGYYHQSARRHSAADEQTGDDTASA